MRREVCALEVHCPFVEEGCSWKGELGFLEVHLDQFWLLELRLLEGLRRFEIFFMTLFFGD